MPSREDRWSRVESLLDRLLDTPESERHALLASAASQIDPEVARQAAELLDEMSSAGVDLLDGQALGDFEAARPLIERAVRLNGRHVEPTSFSRIASEINLATVRLELGELGQAKSLYRQSLERFEMLLGESHQATARVRTLYARCLHVAGEVGEAESQFRRSLEDQRASPDPMKMAETLIGLGTLLSDTGRPREAQMLLREAVEERLASHRPVPWRLAEARLELGGALLRDGSASEAGELIRSASAVLEETLPAENFRRGRSRRLLEELDLSLRVAQRDG